DTLDMTVTAAGSRMMARNISMPLTDAAAINRRLDVVSFFVENEKTREQARGFLRECADIERALARLSLERGGPRDLACIRDTLARAIDLCRILGGDTPEGIQKALARLTLWGAHHPLIDQLSRALADNLP